MSDINKIAVKITGDESSLKQATSEAKKDLDSVSQSAISFGNIITGTALGSMLGGAITKAFGKLRMLMGEADESFKTSSASLTKLATIMQQRGATQQEYDDIIKLTQAEQKLGVISADAMQNGLQEMATYVGQAESLKKLTNTMNNLVVQMHGYDASAYNVMQTATMMGKVLQGQTGGMERIGYHLTEAEKALFNFGTEEERVALLIDIVNNNIGNLNRRLGETDAGKQMQLAHTWSDLKAQVGELASAVGTMLVPAFSAVANAVATAIGWIKAFFKLFGAKFATAAETQAVNVDNAGDAIDNYGGSVAGAAKKIKRSLATFDEMNVLTETAASSGGGGGGSSDGVDILEDLEASLDAINWSSLIPDIDLPDWIKNLTGIFSDIDLGIVKGAFSDLWQSIQAGAEPVLSVLSDIWNNYFKPIVTWVGNEALPAFFNALGGAVEFLGNLIQSVWEVALKPFIDAFLVPIAQWTGGTVVKVLNKIGDGLKTIAKNKNIMNILAKGIGAISAAIAVAKVADFFSTFSKGLSILKSAWDAGLGLGTAMGVVATETTGLTSKVATLAQGPLTLLQKGFSTLWTTIQAHPIATIIAAIGTLLLTNETFRESLGNLLNAVLTPLGTVLDSLSTILGGIISSLMGIVGSILDPIFQVISIISEALGIIVGFIGDFIGLGIQAVLTPILAVLELISPVLEFIKGIIDALLAPLKALFGWLGNLLGITNDNTEATKANTRELTNLEKQYDRNGDGALDLAENMNYLHACLKNENDAEKDLIMSQKTLAEKTKDLNEYVKKYNLSAEELIQMHREGRLGELEQGEALNDLTIAVIDLENANYDVETAQQKLNDSHGEAQSASNQLKEKYDALGSAMVDLAKDGQMNSEIYKDVTQKMKELETEIKNTGKNVGQMRDWYDEAYRAGARVAQGAANGVRANAQLYINAMILMGNLGDEAFRRYNIIRSPSRLFRKLGGYVAEGAALGVEDEYDDYKNAIIGLAKVGEETFEKAPQFKDLGSIDIADQFDELSARAEGKLSLENEATNGAIDQLAMAINNLANQGQQITVKIGEETLIDKVVDGINNANMMRNQSVLNL